MTSGRTGFATPDEVATYLSMTKNALAQARYRGTGPRFVKIGSGTVRYSWADVDAYVELNTFTATNRPETVAQAG